MLKYRRNVDVIDGSLDNHQVMMHLEKGKYYGLNPVAKRIWELVEAPKSFDEITRVLLADFDVTESVCLEQTRTFLDKAVQCDILRMSEED